MFKNLFLSVFISALPGTLFPQQTDKLSVESGFAVNSYFHHDSHPGNANPVDYFFKVEYAGKTTSRGNWSLFVPIGICYSYYTVDYNAVNTPGPGLGAPNIYHHFNLFGGPQVQYDRNKIRFCGAILLNNQYLSARLFGLYNFGKRLWIGPSCEVFFYDIIYSVNERQNKKNIPNYKGGRSSA